MTNRNCKIRQVELWREADTARYELDCGMDGGAVGIIGIAKDSIRGFGRKPVWGVQFIEVRPHEKRKGYATRLYAAAAAHACEDGSRLVSYERIPGAYSTDFWNKQEKKGRAERIPGVGEQGEDGFILNVCGPNIDLSGLPRSKSAKKSRSRSAKKSKRR
jgi:GNAT superfamily N-acetyltransferase